MRRTPGVERSVPRSAVNVFPANITLALLGIVTKAACYALRGTGPAGYDITQHR